MKYAMQLMRIRFAFIALISLSDDLVQRKCNSAAALLQW